MGERRWGRVTVEGWLEERHADAWTLVSANGVYRGEVLKDFASMEFLPEPVTFKDGDALCYSAVPRVYLRVNGEWLGTGGSHRWPDAAMVRDFAAGYCTRLVPEANGD